jgi:membrane protease YdiL (CAAX protease family)
MAAMKTHLAPPERDFDAGEFILVIALAFGLSILGSVSAAFTYSGRPIEFGDDEIASVIIYEAIIAPIVWLLLRRRGWKWSDFAVHASRGSTIFGFILAVLVLGIWYAFEAAFGKVPATLSATLPWVLAVSIANPLFEEMLVLAYVVQALRKRFGLTAAFNVSLAIRLLYHLYQGPLAVIPIAIFGLVVSMVYVRMGRLWPAIVAHGVLDFVGLTID